MLWLTFSDDTVCPRKIELEKANSDPDYFQKKILDTFPELPTSEFSLSRRLKDGTEKEIPEHINNVKDLSSQYKTGSAFYVRPKVRITFHSQ